ncbi:MAG: MnmC family methyltransferase, partial [Cyanobacteria bacterium J06623_7]
MNDSQFRPQPTADGSYTFFSAEFQETFHSSFGAKQEAEVRYIQPCAIKQLAIEQSVIRLLDVCYGLGYNTAAALTAIWATNPSCKVELYALEISAKIPQAAVNHNLLAVWPPSIGESLAELSNKSKICHSLLQAQLILGDARETIKQLVKQGWQADAIFLDPFSPPKCPQLWTVEFLGMLTQ